MMFKLPDRDGWKDMNKLAALTSTHVISSHLNGAEIIREGEATNTQSVGSNMRSHHKMPPLRSVLKNIGLGLFLFVE